MSSTRSHGSGSCLRSSASSAGGWRSRCSSTTDPRGVAREHRRENGVAPDASPAPRRQCYLAENRRPTSPAMGSFFLNTRLLLADITFVSKAIRTTVLANALDMNVSTVGSLLDKLSHQRKG